MTINLTKNKYFNDKWQAIASKDKKRDEDSIFVDLGKEPVTFRQFNLYNYFHFINEIIKDRGYENSLEVGCGRGTMSLYLAKYLGLRVTLADISEEAVKVAKELFEQYGQSAKFSVEDSENLFFADNSFDVIVSIGLAEHFEDCTKLFSEQYRVLKPGGMMISLNIPKKISMQSVNDVYKFIRKQILRDKQVRKDYYRNEDGPEEYLAAANKCGFKNSYTIDINPFPIITPCSRSLDINLTRFYKRILNFRKMFMKNAFQTNRLMSLAHFLIAEK